MSTKAMDISGSPGNQNAARQDYGKGGMSDTGSSKEESSKAMEMTKAGPPSSSGGPTSSSRSYPKGKSVDLGLAKKFNPMNDSNGGFAIAGVGKGEM